MVTINDIAKKAGVAKSTVSRFLNGGSVSRKTSEKIDAIIKETGYVPNTFAQSLKAKNSKMIGAVIPRLDSFATSTILNGVERYLTNKGYKLTIVNANLDEESEIDALKHFEVTKMDGVIFLMTHFSQVLDNVMREVDVPIVAVGQDYNWVNTVYFDEFQAGHLMADYLYDLGHRDILFLSVTNTDQAVGVNRKIGLKEAFLSFKGTKWKEIETGFRVDEAYNVTKNILQKQIPSLIVASTDMIAIGVMKACQEAKLSIPNDISIAGFGNHYISEAFYPGLTTVSYPYYQAGEMAAQQLLEKIRNAKHKAQVKLPTQLVVCQSVKEL